MKLQKILTVLAVLAVTSTCAALADGTDRQIVVRAALAVAEVVGALMTAAAAAGAPPTEP